MAPDGAPTEYVAHPEDWVLPGRDYDNSRTAAASTITSENVDRLEIAWEADMQGALSTVPLIVGDTVFVEDSTGHVHALAATTAEALWSTEQSGFNIGPFGVAVADGRVFGRARIERDRRVRRRRRAQQLWIARAQRDADGRRRHPARRVRRDRVRQHGAGERAGHLHGRATAASCTRWTPTTGEDLWTFDTVESDDLWGNPAVNSGGGAWYPPAIDTRRGVVYCGIANPAPFPGTEEFPNGSSRPGANLYTDSVVAFDVRTGALQWYHQVHPARPVRSRSRAHAHRA